MDGFNVLVPIVDDIVGPFFGRLGVCAHQGEDLILSSGFYVKSMGFLCVKGCYPEFFKVMTEVGSKDWVSCRVYALGYGCYAEVGHSRVVVFWAEMVFNRAEVGGMFLLVNAVAVFPHSLLEGCRGFTHILEVATEAGDEINDFFRFAVEAVV